MCKIKLLNDYIISKTWGNNEDELKALKADLAALDRKITAELAPTHEVLDDRMGVNHDEKDGEEVRRDEQPQQSQRVEKSGSILRLKGVYGG